MDNKIEMEHNGVNKRIIFNEDASVNGDSSNSDVKTVGLKKTIGLVNSITIIIGVMIGSGIFISPTGIIKDVQSVGASLIIWVACGLFSLMGAYSYAELGTIIHRSGGDYIYVYEAFGPFFGFLRLWVDVMVARPVSIAILALTFARYIVQPFYNDCEPPQVVLILFSMVCILLVALVNSVSVRLATKVQDLFTFAKLAALFMIIITGFVQIGLGRYDSLREPFANSNWSPGALTNAFYVGLFAYSGWNYLNTMIEEMRNPQRDLPLSIVISCLSVTVIYALANLAYLTVVTGDEILTTPAVAITFAIRMYSYMWWIMPLFVAMSTFGGVNGSIMSTSRMFFTASETNQMPKFLCLLQLNKSTPIPAVLFTSLVSICYLFVDDIFALITYMGFVQWLAIGFSVSIVIVFRVTRPNIERPVKVPIVFAAIYVAVTLFLFVYAFIASPTEAFLGMLIILTGIPVYMFGCAWKNKPIAFRRFLNELTIVIQKIFKLVPLSRKEE